MNLGCARVRILEFSSEPSRRRRAVPRRHPRRLEDPRVRRAGRDGDAEVREDWAGSARQLVLGGNAVPPPPLAHEDEVPFQALWTV